MKRSSLYLAVLFALAVIAAPYSAFAFLGIDVGVGYWNQTPSGTLTYKPVAGTVGDIDFKNDLHFDTEGQAFVRAKAELPLILPNIYLMYTPMEFKGTGPLTRNISFGNTQFGASVPITSTVTLNHTDFCLFYPIPLLKTATLGKLNVELGLNVRQIAFEGTISGGGQTASKNMTLYLPMIYGGIQVKPISLFSVEVEVRGVSYSGNSYMDYIGRLKVNPLPLLYVGGGFRSEAVKIDANDVKADIKFSGPFAEVGVSF